MSTFDEMKKKADDLVDKAVGRSRRAGDKIAAAVDKVADTIDEKTGGGASAVTAKVDEAVSGAVSHAQSAAAAASQKATEAAGTLKGAVAKKPEEG